MRVHYTKLHFLKHDGKHKQQKWLNKNYVDKLQNFFKILP